MQVPDTWQLVALGDLDAAKRRTIDPAQYPGERFEYYSIPAYQENQTPLTANGRDIASTKLLLEPESILFGKLNPRVEKVWRVRPSSGLRQIGSTEWLPIVPTRRVSPDFVYFLCWSDRVMHLAKGQVSGSTPSRQRVDPTAFYRIRVPLPPLAEQRQIALVLAAVKRSIERQERLIGLFAELKNALMHKLFSEGTRGERLQNIRFGQAPASWKVVPLGDCCEVQTGIAKGRNVEAEQAVSVPYLRVANVQDGRLDLSEMKNITIKRSELSRFSLRPGDVVLTEGGDLDKLGRGFVWRGEITECIHQNHVFVVRPHLSRLSSEYLAYLTQSPYGKRYFLSVAHKTTNLACINTSKLRAFPVVLPALDEQVLIVRTLRILDDRRSAAQGTRDTLDALFRGLLEQLVNAEIRVEDLDLSALNGSAVEPAGAM